MASDSSSRSFGRKNTEGTESIEMTVNISLEHPSDSAFNKVAANGGSTGNSTIFEPSFVNPPTLSSAPRIHNWYMEFKMFSFGGGSMKSKSNRFSILSDFKSKTTLPRFVR